MEYVEANKFLKILNEDLYSLRGAYSRKTQHGHIIYPFDFYLEVWEGWLVTKQDVDRIIENLDININKFWVDYLTILPIIYR